MGEKLQPQLRFPGFEGDWEKEFIKNLAEFIGGGTPNTANEKNWQGQIPWISSSDIIENDIFNIKISRFISKEAIENSATKVIPEGSLLVVSRVGVGKFAVAKQKICTSQDFINLVLNKNKINNYFLAYKMYSNKSTFFKISQGTSIKGFTISDLKSVSIAFPNISEQQKIADYLSTIDIKINLLGEKKTELSRYKKAMMQKLFSRKIRFKDENGKDFPEWEEKRLGEVATFNVLKNKTNLLLSVLTNSAEFGVIKQEDFFDNQIANDKSLNTYIILDKYEFVYNPRISKYAPFGPINMNKLSKGLLSPLYSVFKINENLMCLNFVEFYFKTSKWFRYMAESGNQGARSDRMAVNKTTLANIPILKPPLIEQQKIANFLSALDEGIDKVAEQEKQMQAFKKAMLQQMFV